MVDKHVKALFLLFFSDGAFHVNAFRLGVEGLF